MQHNLTKYSGKMSRQVILLKRVQEALGQEKNNQTITGILDIKISFRIVH